MKRLVAEVILILILAAALLNPQEAGEGDPNGPYIYIVDETGQQTRVQ